MQCENAACMTKAILVRPKLADRLAAEMADARGGDEQDLVRPAGRDA